MRLDKFENVLYHSAILDWFKEDFLAVADDIVSYIAMYINDEDKRFLEKNTVKIKVLKYNWGLNKQ